ncbi:hypothetical protein [Labrenzia sp. DG1229]|nr:hypothetical protein [Labrenzia sp. DG1229]
MIVQALEADDLVIRAVKAVDDNTSICGLHEADRYRVLGWI